MDIGTYYNKGKFNNNKIKGILYEVEGQQKYLICNKLNTNMLSIFITNIKIRINLV